MFLKDPGARLDYRFDWSERLTGGITLVASSWAVAPATADAPAIESSSIDGAETVVWLAGGAPGQVFAVRNRVEFSDGQVDERSLVFRVEDR